MRRPNQPRTADSPAGVLAALLAGGLCLYATGRHGGETADRDSPEPSLFRLARENVLGTSLDLAVLVPDRRDAERCEQAVLDEIDRLERLFSTYDPRSELSRLNAAPWRTGDAHPVSGELHQLLADCASWQERTRGALNCYLGDTVDLWHRAAEEGRAPSPTARADCIARLHQGGFRAGERNGEKIVERLGPGRFDVDAVAKGFIVDRALDAARRAVPSLRGLLLNLGGDIRAWGTASPAGPAAWEVGVADPGCPADNAPPLARVRLADRAVATSGGYARPLAVGDRRVSHILDPRTGLPAGHVLSATAVAGDAATADALATALCVLPPAEGLALVDGIDDAACLIVDREGTPYRSRGWKAIEVSEPAAAGAGAWQDGHRLTVRFELRDASDQEARGRKRKKFKRHYVAAWVEDAQDRPVRLLALWAERKEFKYVKDLDTFWQRRQALGGERQLQDVSRATRPPGVYTLTWDGRDEDGKPVTPGTYSVHIDINREDGPPRGRAQHTHTAVPIACGGAAAEAAGPDQPELAGVKVSYGPDDRKPADEKRP